MTDNSLPPASAALLRRIAHPDVDGMPGALGRVDPAAIGPLLLAGLVAITAVPPAGPAIGDVNDWRNPPQPSIADAMVSPTSAGVAWLAADPDAGSGPSA